MGAMSERQPDMLGGKSVAASRLARVRKHVKPPIPREGHAAPMGSGPDGETCGGCTYCEIFHYRKTYHKCRARAGDHWKGGRKTDIRPLDPACSKFEPLANSQPQAKRGEIAGGPWIDEAASITPEIMAAVMDHLARTRPVRAMRSTAAPGQMDMLDIMGGEEP